MKVKDGKKDATGSRAIVGGEGNASYRERGSKGEEKGEEDAKEYGSSMQRKEGGRACNGGVHS